MKQQDIEFDRTTEMLQSFVYTNQHALKKRTTAIRKCVYRPIAQHRELRLVGQFAFDILSTCRMAILAHMKCKCSKQSIDFWLAHVRRLPGILPMWPSEWVPYSTLAILKWAVWEKDTTLGQANSPGIFGVAMLFDENDLFNCCLIAYLGLLLAEVNNASRWVGKGARLIFKRDSSFEIDIPTDVRKAVEHYERRRPHEPLFADEGLYVSNMITDVSAFARRPFFTLGVPHAPIDTAILTANHKHYHINYMLIPASEGGFLQALNPYAEAIEDVFHTSVAAIMQVLCGMSALLINSVPFPTNNHGFTFDNSLTDQTFVQQFGFMINLYRKGFVRFPEEYLRNCLSGMCGAPFAGSLQSSPELVDSFFGALCLRPEHRIKIDVARLEPLPVIYTSPGGQCYFDLLWVKDFLRWLIVQSREWFSSQHGDRFTLALKKLVEQDCKEARVIAWKRLFKDAQGNQAEVDLLVEKSRVLYSIECKAFRKSRDFWEGSPKAISQRTQRIRSAVNQAIEAASILRQVVADGDDELFRKCDRVEWVVCIPTQEYLKPLDRYGLLSRDIPRVCTPEELIRHLTT